MCFRQKVFFLYSLVSANRYRPVKYFCLEKWLYWFSGDRTSTPSEFLRPHFQNSFALTWFFSTFRSRMSRNRCKLRHKLHNDQNIPPLSPFFFTYIFQSIFIDNWGHFFTNLRPNNPNIFFITFFFPLGIKMSKNMCKLRHKLCTAKNRVAIRFTWQNEP